MSKTAHRRALTISNSRGCADFAGEARRLREDAQARYGEVDLLVAALRDHVRDLQIERDRLRSELASLKDRAQLQSAGWMWRGMKPGR